MMKKKFQSLLTLACLMCSGTVWGQTDVTSTYLVNPSFEYSAEGTAYTAETSLSNGENFYGWKAPTLGSQYANIDITKSASHSGFGAATASEGSYYFYNRQGWGDNTATLSQTTTSSLPIGKYYISVDYKCAEADGFKGSTLGWKISSGGSTLSETSRIVGVSASNGGTYLEDSPWKQYGAWFTITEEQQITIEITETLKGSGRRADICLDNVRLYIWDTDDQTNYDNATPESPLDVTAQFVTNPYFDSNTTGWTSTTGAQNSTRATNQAGAFSGGFFENWNGSAKTSGKMSQTASGLPNGVYKLTIAAFGNNASSSTTGLNVFAGSDKTPVTSSTPSFYSVQTTVNDGSLEFGLELSDGNTSNWVGIDNVRLEYLGNSIDLTAWTNAKSAAETALTQYDERYATTERQAVINLKNTADPTSASQMNTMVTELNQAVSTYRTKAANEVLVESKSALTTFINTTLPATYPNSSSDVLNTDISKWASSTYVVMEAAEHWSEASKYKYYEQSSAQWGQSSWSIAAEQTVNLPVGSYAFVVTARASAGVTSKMTVNGTEVALSNNGNTGYGIATDGEATYDMSKTYANTTGRGWEYAYVEFELTEATDVTFKLESSASSAHNWVSIANPVLYYNDAAKTNMELVRKNAILATIATTLSTVPASDVMNVTVLSTLNEKKTAAENASTDNSVEELNTINSELVDAISAANTSINNYTTAKALIDAASSLDETGKASYASNETVSEVSSAYNNRNLVSVSDEQKTAMKAALVTAVKDQTSDNAVFTLALVNPSFEEGIGGWTNDRNTTGTYDYRTDETNPADGLKLLNVWAPQFNWSNVWQKVILPAGQYTLSAKARTNAEPLENKTQVRAYINYVMQSASNGLTYTADETAWNDGSKWISLSTTFSITEETEVELGIYSTGKNISGNSQGWFQVDDFQLVRNGAPTATMTIAEANKWATFYAPFDVDLPANVYSYAITVDEGVAVRSKLGGDDAYTLPANTPVLVYTDNAGGYSETFTADAATGTPAAKPASNYLVGTATAISAPASVTDEYTNYILQNYKDKDGLAWYKVNNNRLPANRAYLSVPASTDVKSIFDFTTAIESESIVVSSQPAALHNLTGQTVGKDYKGIVITNGKKYLNK